MGKYNVGDIDESERELQESFKITEIIQIHGNHPVSGKYWNDSEIKKIRIMSLEFPELVPPRIWYKYFVVRNSKTKMIALIMDPNFMMFGSDQVMFQLSIANFSDKLNTKKFCGRKYENCPVLTRTIGCPFTLASITITRLINWIIFVILTQNKSRICNGPACCLINIHWKDHPHVRNFW